MCIYYTVLNLYKNTKMYTFLHEIPTLLDIHQQFDLTEPNICYHAKKKKKNRIVVTLQEICKNLEIFVSELFH